MVKYLKHSAMTDYTALPNGEGCANGKAWQRCLGKQELYAEALCAPRRHAIFGRDEESNGIIVIADADADADAEDASVFAFAK